MSQRFFNPAPQFFYQNGQPLSGGLLYFYVAGSTLTPKDTYSDNGLSIANANPVALSSSGVMPNVFLSGVYRVILKDKDGVQQWDRDSINSIINLVGNAWDSTVTYGLGGTNIVYASDAVYYVSIQANNQGHDPAGGANPLWWKAAFDYFAIGQTIVANKRVAVGDSTTGLTGVAITNGYAVIGNTAAGIAGINTTTKGTVAVGDGTTTGLLPVGTNSQALVADSTQTLGVKWASVIAPGTILLATLTPTAAANVDFLTTFSSTYDNYLIVGDGILPATGSPSLQMRVAVAGTANAGSNYAPMLSGSTTTTSNTFTEITSQPVLSSGKGCNFTVNVINANDTTNNKGIIAFSVSQRDATPTWDSGATASPYIGATAISGVRFLWSGGQNFAAVGKIRIYGISST